MLLFLRDIDSTFIHFVADGMKTFASEIVKGSCCLNLQSNEDRFGGHC